MDKVVLYLIPRKLSENNETKQKQNFTIAFKRYKMHYLTFSR